MTSQEYKRLQQAYMIADAIQDTADEAIDKNHNKETLAAYERAMNVLTTAENALLRGAQALFSGHALADQFAPAFEAALADKPSIRIDTLDVCAKLDPADITSPAVVNYRG